MDDWRYTFIRAFDVVLKREIKLKTSKHFLDADDCAKWLAGYYRNLEFREYAPWDEAVHGGGTIYPVPVQNVKFDPPKPNLVVPDRKRISQLIQRKPILKRG